MNCSGVCLETTSYKGSRWGCFGPDPSVITLFTTVQMNRTKWENEPEFYFNGLNTAGVKTPLGYKPMFVGVWRINLITCVYSTNLFTCLASAVHSLHILPSSCHHNCDSYYIFFFKFRYWCVLVQCFRLHCRDCCSSLPTCGVISSSSLTLTIVSCGNKSSNK